MLTQVKPGVAVNLKRVQHAQLLTGGERPCIRLTFDDACCCPCGDDCEVSGDHDDVLDVLFKTADEALESYRGIVSPWRAS